MLRQKTAQCLDSGPLYLLPFIYLSSMFSHQYLYLCKEWIFGLLCVLTLLMFFPLLWKSKQNKQNRQPYKIRQYPEEIRFLFVLNKKKKKATSVCIIIYLVLFLVNFLLQKIFLSKICMDLFMVIKIRWTFLKKMEFQWN